MNLNIKKQYESRVIKAATFLGVLGFISLNIYLPSLPAIAHDFHVQTSDLKFSITLFLIGFASSQFYWGSLSAKYGRKRAIFHGLIFANLGTIMAMVSINITMFNIARLLEGLGIGCASVLCRALLTDVLPQEKLSRAMSIVVSLANVMPALAPIFGGYLVLLFNWRIIFLFLLIYTLTLTIIIERSLKETNSNIKENLTIKNAIAEYKQVLNSRRFIGYLLPYLILGGGMIGYYSATPFIFITNLHIAPQTYSYLSIFTVLAYTVGANLSTFIRRHLDYNGAILLGALIAVFAGIILFILAFTSHLTVVNVLIPMVFYLFACGVVSPNANTCALSELRHIAGATAAVIGSSIYAASAVFTMYITSLDLSSLYSLAQYILVLGLIATFGFYFLIIRKSKI